MDLFEKEKKLKENEPMAVRMRPRSLDDFIGQEHILGKEKLLRRLIESDTISSVILYGPPGCGKTTLAHHIEDIQKRRSSQQVLLNRSPFFAAMNWTASAVVFKIVPKISRVHNALNAPQGSAKRSAT